MHLKSLRYVSVQRHNDLDVGFLRPASKMLFGIRKCHPLTPVTPVTRGARGFRAARAGPGGLGSPVTPAAPGSQITRGTLWCLGLVLSCLVAEGASFYMSGRDARLLPQHSDYFYRSPIRSPTDPQRPPLGLRSRLKCALRRLGAFWGAPQQRGYKLT